MKKGTINCLTVPQRKNENTLFLNRSLIKNRRQVIDYEVVSER